MKYLKIFESFEDTDKYLIELSSTNSRGVNRDSDERIKYDAEKWWSMDGYVYKLDFSKKYKSLSNEDLTKKVVGRTDLDRFGRDIEGFLQNSKFRFKKEIDHDKTRSMNKYLSYFKDHLKIDQKLEFSEILEEYGFIIVRDSYIYKVVDSSEIDENINTVINIILSASNHML